MGNGRNEPSEFQDGLSRGTSEEVSVDFKHKSPILRIVKEISAMREKQNERSV